MADVHMTPAFLLGDLESIFRSMPNDYVGLKTRAEGAVRRWQWAIDRIHVLEPLWHERHQFSKGRWLKQAPSNEADQYEYGFDDSSRVRVERQHVRFERYPERRWCHETFYFYGADTVDEYRFDYRPEKDATSFSRASLIDGTIVLMEARGAGGVLRERYSWVDAQVVAVEVEHAEVTAQGGYQELKPRARYTATYNIRGLLDELVRQSPGLPGETPAYRQVVYKRRAKGVTLESLVRALQPALTDEIVRAVSRAAIKEPAYRLALAWSPGQTESLPPSIGIGLESYRARLLAGDAPFDALMLWNPAECSTWVEVRSEAMTSMCQQLNQYCAAHDTWLRSLS